LKSDDAKRVIVFQDPSTAAKTLLVLERVIIFRAPREHISPVDLTGTFKIDQPKLTTMNKNMRRLAIAPTKPAACALAGAELKPRDSVT
jgi:hypothetical protein